MKVKFKKVIKWDNRINYNSVKGLNRMSVAILYLLFPSIYLYIRYDDILGLIVILILFVLLIIKLLSSGINITYEEV